MYRFSETSINLETETCYIYDNIFEQPYTLRTTQNIFEQPYTLVGENQSRRNLFLLEPPRTNTATTTFHHRFWTLSLPLDLFRHTSILPHTLTAPFRISHTLTGVFIMRLEASPENSPEALGVHDKNHLISFRLITFDRPLGFQSITRAFLQEIRNAI
ncbi:hypothetical protein HanXRQr2_Chr15g0689341 [Helianthus annuus]|uniref:Uncharacterized protein n=1 Tax=Helianthus annuus TaxID=4232 RepID=A0A9K3E025_HELAN|nr:hypothetical protein HanXRQr2_Chr15g0689341 [Helianthus annuus]KAJ0455256.1 hypothetical protein HanIR_Chr15g0749121 [Helianthus annuus]KAJ0830937.1 hypothetical protein HanPSC8_Chr15g0661191 [Helianthus annuus]